MTTAASDRIIVALHNLEMARRELENDRGTPPSEPALVGHSIADLTVLVGPPRRKTYGTFTVPPRTREIPIHGERLNPRDIK